MPHDRKGNLIQEGDKVILEGAVKSVQANPDYCNVTVSSLRFDELRDANVRRLPEFKNPKGEPAHSKTDGSDWSPLEWGGAMAGEAGELLNLLKKLKRGDYTLDDKFEEDGTYTFKDAIADECADVVCYLDHVANQLGIDLGDAVRKKFNEVSDRVGSKVKL